jgi:hypothetical protein
MKSRPAAERDDEIQRLRAKGEITMNKSYSWSGAIGWRRRAHGPAVKTLISSCNASLGNRLCVHAGCLRVARELGRKLRIHWPVYAGRHSALNSLVRLTSGVEEFTDELDLHNGPLCYDECASGSRNDFMAIRRNDKSDTVIVTGYAFPFLEGERSGYWEGASHIFERISECLKAFQPVEAIRDAAMAFPLPKGTVGVHWRTGRGLPSEDNARFQMSRREDFIRLMRQSGAKQFYVAADILEVAGQFPGEILPRLQLSAINMCGLDHARDALVENLILSRCDAVIGTNGSYFSVLAALWRNVPLIVAKSGAQFP